MRGGGAPPPSLCASPTKTRLHRAGIERHLSNSYSSLVETAFPALVSSIMVEADYSPVPGREGIHSPEYGGLPGEDADAFPANFFKDKKGRTALFSRSYLWRRRMSYAGAAALFFVVGLGLSWEIGKNRGHIGGKFPLLASMSSRHLLY